MLTAQQRKARSSSKKPVPVGAAQVTIAKMDKVVGQPAATEPATEQPATTTIICAPWSKEWDVSEGQWVSDWYRWCVDSSVYDPMVESSWYKEWGSREYGGQVNLCPESGRCTVSPGGGVQMIKGN